MGLKLDQKQSNDGKIFYLIDESTWGDGTLPSFQDMVANCTAANLRIKYATQDELNSDGTIDYIDNGGNGFLVDITSIIQNATTQYDLVYQVISTDLSLGSNIPLYDGVYLVMYTITSDGVTYEFETDLEVLLDALIKSEVYKRVSMIDYRYLCSNNYFTKDIDDTILIKALYDSMISSAYVARKEEILKLLDVLQRQTE